MKRELRGKVPVAERHVVAPFQPKASYGAIGWAMIGGGVLAAAGAAVLREDSAAAGAGVTVALVAGSLGTMFAGAPLARAGKPSPFRIGFLFAMGALGLFLQTVSSPVVALGVAQVTFAILVLSASRWPPGSSGGARESAATGVQPGSVAGAAATFLVFLAVCGVALTIVDSRVGQLAICAVALFVLLRWWSRLAAIYRNGSVEDLDA
jgi:hypothetical protein